MITLTLFNFDDFLWFLEEYSVHEIIAISTSYTALNHMHRYEIVATVWDGEEAIIRYQHAVIQDLFPEEASKKASEKVKELMQKLRESLDEEEYRIVEGLWHDSSDSLLRRL